MKNMCKHAFIAVAIALFLIPGLFAYGPSMVWEKAYGIHAQGQAVLETPDGGYIVSGYLGTETNQDVWLLKTDQFGDTLWTKTYGGSDEDAGYTLHRTADGCYVIAGQTGSYGAGNLDVYLVKTDSYGNMLWQKTYGGINRDRCFESQETHDKGFILAGSTTSFGSGDFDFYAIKTDSSGEVMWTKTYGGINKDICNSVQQTNDGGYIFAGFSESFDVSVYVVKTDSLGDTLWTKTYGTHKQWFCRDIEQTYDNGYIMTGHFTTFGTGGTFDLFLIRMDSQGDTLWTRCFSDSFYGQGSSVVETPDSAFVITGVYGWYWQDVWLLKVDDDGDTSWTAVYGAPYWDEQGVDVQMTSDGGFIITGGRNNDALYLVKTSPDPTGHGTTEDYNTQVSLANVEVFPNPFREKADIRFNMPRPVGGVIEIQIRNAAGRLVKSLRHAPDALRTTLSWDGTDDAGRKLPSGVYFIRFQADDFTSTEKVALLR